MIYMPNFRQISWTKLVLFVNLIFLLMHDALVEPPVDWEKHGMFYGLVNRHKVT